MKKVFTKGFFLLLLTCAGLALAVPAQAQTFTGTVINSGTTLGGRVSAITTDPFGNVWVVNDPTYTQTGGQLIEYVNGTGTPQTIGTGIEDGELDDDQAFGVASDSQGNIYVCTSSNNTDGFIYKYTKSSSYSRSTLIAGNASVGYFYTITIDANDNLYAIQYNAAGNTANAGQGDYEVARYPTTSASSPGGTVLYNQLDYNFFAQLNTVADPYTEIIGLQVDAGGNIYYADGYDIANIHGDGGHIYKLLKPSSGNNYTLGATVETNLLASALAMDPTRTNLYAIVSLDKSDNTCNVVEYAGGTGTPVTLYSGIKADADFAPFALAYVSSTEFFVGDGGEGSQSTIGDLVEIIGPPSTQASTVTFSPIGSTTATANWANGDGADRAVFINQTSSTSSVPSPVNGTAYTQASGGYTTGTQIGTSGWYCVYNGTGVLTSISGLTANTAYRVAVVEYNGGTNLQTYLTTTGTGNPANFTTVQPTLTVTGGTVTVPSTTAGTAGPSTSFTISGSNLTAGIITASAPTGFDVSANNSTWASTATVSETGTLGSTPIYVRLSASDGVSTPSGNVNIGGGGAGTQTQAVSGTVTNPSTTISSLTASTTNTNSSSVTYTATFAASITGLNSGDFLVINTGVSGAFVSNVTGSGTTWTVTVSTGSGDGSLQLEMNSSSGVSPSVSNATAISPFTGTTVTVDKMAPTVTFGAPSVSIATNTVVYQITLSDPGVISPGDITPNTTGNVNSGPPSISGSGTSYTVTFAGISGDGTLSISLNAGVVHDAAGNTSALTTSAPVTVDNTAPTVSSITAATPSNATPTNATSVSYTVTFSEAVTGVTPGAFTATASSVSTTGITVTPVSGSVYVVNITGISGNGTLRLDLNSSGTGITDLAGNAISGGFTGGDVYTIDDTPPAVNSITAVSPSNVTPTNATSVSYTVTFSEAVTGVTSGAFTATASSVSTTGITVTPVSASVYVVNITGISGDGTLRLDLNSSGTGIQDLAGNAIATGFTSGDTYIIDNTPPTATISAPSVTTIGNNGSGTVSYTVTYADANFNTSSLTGAGISLNISGTANGTVNVTGSGATYTVTISNISGLGTLGISVTGGFATDLAGNTDAGAGPSATFAVLSSDATLNGLTVSNVTFTSPFAPGTLSYTANVSNAVASVTVTPAVNDGSATVTVNGVAVTSGTASAGQPLSVGDNTILVAVTAQDGTIQTYSITITRAQSSNNLLTRLSISSGSLVPVAGTPNFTVNVTNATSVLTVTPFTADPTATVTIGVNSGTAATVASGTPSGNLPLNIGTNTVTVIVTAQNGTTQPYVLTVTRAQSSNNLLTHLSISSGSLVPVAGTPNFTVNVTNATSALTVTPFTADPTATVTIGVNSGTTATVASGTPSGNLTLNVGTNTVTVIVTAQDGTTQPYVLTVTRAQSSNIALTNISISSGTLVPVAGTPNFTVNVTNATSAVTVTPFTADPTATVTIGVNGGTAATVASGTPSGNLSLNVGANTITIIVTAQDGTTQPYVLTVTRAQSSNIALTNISISSGTLVPVAGTPNYTVNVTNVTSAVTVTPFTADPTATVTIGVNGGTAATVASGTPSANLSLNVGTNTITIIVTAQDGTTQPYVITATRASLSSDISLVRISISSGTMVPVTGTPNYTASVTNATSAITVTPFTTDPASTVTIGINGGTAAAVASGTPSANLPLNVGANTITIIVTAQDGTTQPYVLTVTRAQSSNIALTHISISSGTLVPVTGTPNYTVNVTNAVTAVTVTALVTDPLSTMTISVNSGTPAAVASGTPSGNLSLNVGTNTITIIVTAQDGTTQPFVITVTRASGALLALYQPLSVTTNPGDSLSIENDGIMVHQGVSPNGDGINDVLTIDGITRYPDNSLQIIDRNGALLYQAKGYDNSSKAFDGHSNINGRLLQSGTYFYSLDYSVNGQAKHKTGFILLKY